MPLIQRLVSGCLWLCMCWAASAGGQTITIAAEDDWPPYSALSADRSRLEGFTPDLVRAVFKRQGITVDLVPVPFARCLAMAKAGKAVACFNNFVTDENRNEFIWHRTPLFEDGTSIFALAPFDGQGLTTKSLEGTTVGITVGYTYASAFMQNPKIQRVQASSDAQLVKMLLAKRVRFIVLNTLPGMLRIKSDPASAGKVVPVGVVSRDDAFLSFSKAHPDGQRLANVFEAGLVEFKASGAYDRLQAEFRQRLGLSR